MKIKVSAKPLSHVEKIEKITDVQFTVWVKEPPVRGLANAAIRNVLATYFKVSKSQVRLISGYSSKEKTFEID